MVHLEDWGVYIATEDATTAKATVKIQTSVVNETSKATVITVETSVIDGDGKVVKTTQTKENVEAGKSFQFKQDIAVTNPKLWNVETPFLYKTLTKVIAAGKVVDDQLNTFGIRAFKFDAATGFWLNGKNFKLKGVCLHHDGGSVGAAVPLSVWKYRFALLKEVGVNAIRTAHNPVAPEFFRLVRSDGFPGNG